MTEAEARLLRIMAEAVAEILTVAATGTPPNAVYIEALQRRLRQALRQWTMSGKLTGRPTAAGDTTPKPRIPANPPGGTIRASRPRRGRDAEPR